MIKNQTLRASVITTTVLFLVILFIPALAGAQGRGNNSDKKAEVEARIQERKEAAEARIAEKRESAEVKSAEKRQEACEKRVDKLESSMDKLYTQASKLLSVMDRFNERVKGFYDKGQLTVSNFDELYAAVGEAQDAATVEVEALSELNVDIDCTDENAVLSVSAYRTSAGAAKAALKAYRRALVDLISSMKSAAAEQLGDDSSSESENETETEDETDAEPIEEREATEVEAGTGEESSTPTESVPETPENEEVNQ